VLRAVQVQGQGCYAFLPLSAVVTHQFDTACVFSIRTSTDNATTSSAKTALQHARTCISILQPLSINFRDWFNFSTCVNVAKLRGKRVFESSFFTNSVSELYGQMLQKECLPDEMDFDLSRCSDGLDGRGSILDTCKSLLFSTSSRPPVGLTHFSVSLLSPPSLPTLIFLSLYPLVSPSIRNFATGRKVAASIPNKVNYFFSIYLILPAALGSGVHSASNRNEYQKQKNNVSVE
jgi:hypothetical protein